MINFIQRFDISCEVKPARISWSQNKGIPNGTQNLISGHFPQSCMWRVRVDSR